MTDVGDVGAAHRCCSCWDEGVASELAWQAVYGLALASMSHEKMLEMVARWTWASQALTVSSFGAHIGRRLHVNATSTWAGMRTHTVKGLGDVRRCCGRGGAYAGGRGWRGVGWRAGRTAAQRCAVLQSLKRRLQASRCYALDHSGCCRCCCFRHCGRRTDQTDCWESSLRRSGEARHLEIRDLSLVQSERWASTEEASCVRATMQGP